MLENKIFEKYNIHMSEIEKYIEIPPESSFGDFSLPCFVLAKELKINPKLIAEELQRKIMEDETIIWLDQVKTVGGYLNLFIDRSFYVKRVINKPLDDNYGNSDIGEGKTICMDYSSPNIAKIFHVGHLRTTIIGNSLYKIFSKAGYHVVRINHLGDWGTQFGKLIVAYKLWSDEKLVEEKGIEELLRIYIKFNKEAENDPEMIDSARLWFVKMEQGNSEALAIWKWFKEISLKEFERVYRILNVKFDSYNGESFYMDKIPALVKELCEKELLQESEGANIINLDEYGMPPCLITKKDGSSIYHSRDIAAALYRKKTYDFEQCLYVTGMEQKLHFMQVFKVLELMGYSWAKECHHIPYGLVSMSGEKLSTRKGNIVYAEDILKEAISRASRAIEEKNPELPNKEDVAEKVGVGAVIFHDLTNQLIREVQFDWEAVLNFDGMTAPYIQYTFARANSILRKIGQVESNIDAQLLTDDASYGLIKHISNYNEAMKEAVLKYEPCIIARYVYNL
ncbi:MAG: arginine--tRNA ligase, partial [Clostridiales bacterium]|nr:arginine--tRNA ligase [Clostridiales bacterium]